MTTSLLSENYDTWILELETTYGTDAVDTAITTDANIVYLAVNSAGSIVPIANNFIPARARPGQGGVKSSKVKDNCDVTLPIPVLSGVGTNNTPENLGKVLQAAGFTEAVGTGDTLYTLGTDNRNSLSVRQHRRNLVRPSGDATAWRAKRATGGVFSLSLNFAIGAELIATAVGKGANYDDWTPSREYFDSADKPAMEYDGSAHAYAGSCSVETGERMICKSASIEYNSAVIPVNTASLDYAFNITPMQIQNGDPISTRIIRTRGDGANITGSALVLLTDGDAGYDDIRDAEDSEEEANLVFVLQGETRQLTITQRVQWQARPVESAQGGATAFECAFIGTDDFASACFGDNGATWLFEDSP